MKKILLKIKASDELEKQCEEELTQTVGEVNIEDLLNGNITTGDDNNNKDSEPPSP